MLAFSWLLLKVTLPYLHSHTGDRQHICHLYTMIYLAFQWQTDGCVCNIVYILIQKNIYCDLSFVVKKIRNSALAGIGQWIELQTANQRVAGSVPSQGTCLGGRLGAQWGGTWVATTHWCYSLSLSPSLLLSLKINKILKKRNSKIEFYFIYFILCF